MQTDVSESLRRAVGRARVTAPETRGLTAREYADTCEGLSTKHAQERLREAVYAGTVKVGKELRMTITGYARHVPVYMEMDEEAKP